MQQKVTRADILGLVSRFLLLHIIIYYRPSVVAVFFHPSTAEAKTLTFSMPS